MNTNPDSKELDEITKKIIGCAFNIGNELGTGFLEKVYENALIIALKEKGLEVDQQHPIKIKFHGHTVGDYICDLLINATVIIEIKSVRILDSTHMAQCLNYLKATGMKVCLLINFGRKKVDIRRLVNHF